MDRSFLKLIHSNRVSGPTREVFVKRLAASPAEYIPQAFSLGDFLLLRVVLGRLIPQEEDRDFIDLAATIDLRRAKGEGDGWRYATLPPDRAAGSLGLQLLQSTARRLFDLEFASLNRAQQDTLLRQVQEGQLEWPELDGRKWFEELLVEATEIYVSHPVTLAAIGFSGVAFLPRWPEIGLNSARPWEPVGK